LVDTTDFHRVLVCLLGVLLNLIYHMSTRPLSTLPLGSASPDKGGTK
jgi:hypothetical protein